MGSSSDIIVLEQVSPGLDTRVTRVNPSGAAGLINFTISTGFFTALDVKTLSAGNGPVSSPLLLTILLPTPQRLATVSKKAQRFLLDSIMVTL
jgi:hypothetical protein